MHISNEHFKVWQIDQIFFYGAGDMFEVNISVNLDSQVVTLNDDLNIQDGNGRKVAELNIEYQQNNRKETHER